MLALDVDALLARPLSELRGFVGANGKRLTPRQVRDELEKIRANGQTVLPVGGERFNFLTMRGDDNG